MNNLHLKKNKTTLLKWSDAKCRSQLHDEIGYASDPCPPYYLPLELFTSLKKNSAIELLLRGLDKFAPLYPCLAYRGEASLWLSPPPSGSGNSVYIVVGKDMFGQMRLVGCNYFDQLMPPSNNKKFDFKNFFRTYDSICKCHRHDHERLIRDAIEAASTSAVWCATDQTNLISDLTQTMPIYLLVIDEERALFQTFPAIANGNHPADFSFEFIGEVV